MARDSGVGSELDLDLEDGSFDKKEYMDEERLEWIQNLFSFDNKILIVKKCAPR